MYKRGAAVIPADKKGDMVVMVDGEAATTKTVDSSLEPRVE